MWNDRNEKFAIASVFGMIVCAFCLWVFVLFSLLGFAIFYDAIGGGLLLIVYFFFTFWFLFLFFDGKKS